MAEKFLRFIYFVFLVVMGLGLFIGVILSTKQGKENLTDLLNAFLKTESYQVQVARIDRFFPLEIQVDRIDLIQEKKVWLQAFDISIHSDLWQLLGGRGLVLQTKVRDLQLLPKRVGKKQTSVAKNQLSMPVSFDVQAEIEHFNLSQEVLGKKVEGNVAKANFAYDRTVDQLKGEVQLGVQMLRQAMDIGVDFKGALNDFDLNYHVTSQLIEFNELSVQNIKGDGTFEQLPWNVTGKTSLHLQLQDDEIHLTTQLDYKDEVLRLAELRALGEGVDIDSSFSYDLSKRKLQGKFKFDLRDAPLLSAYFQQKVTGSLKGQGELSSEGGDLSGRASFEIKDFKAPFAHIEWALFDGQAEAVFSQPDGQFRLETKQAGYRGRRINSAMIQANFHQGVGTASAAIQGESLKLNSDIEATITPVHKQVLLKTFKGQYEDAPFNLKNPVQLVVDADVVTLSPAEISVLKTTMNVEGKMRGQDLDFKANGAVDLTVLSQLFLTSGDILRGKPEFDFVLQGTLTKPKLKGNIALTKGSYENLQYGTILREIEVNANADFDQLKIHKLSAKDSQKGSVSLAGSYQFNQQVFDMSAKAKALRVIDTDQMQMTVRKADLALKGPLMSPLLSGTITLDRFVYDISKDAGADIYELNVENMPAKSRPEFCAPREKSEPSDFNLTYQVDIKIPPVLSVSGLGLKSRWKGSLKLRESLASPLVTGKVGLDSGSINFLGQNIVLKSGEVLFDGQPDNIPLINATAEVKRSELTMRIMIQGRINRPRIELESDPPLPREEILSQILFGKDKTELSAFEALRLGQALIAYNNPGRSGDFLDMMTSNLGLDQFSIGTGEATGEEVVQIGQRLNDKVRVNIDQGLNPEDSKIEVEVNVTDNITVTASHGLAESSDAVAVKYNWDY